MRVAKIRTPRELPVGRQAVYLRWGDHVESLGLVLLRHIPAY